MDKQFFLPIGKRVEVVDTNGEYWFGILEGFIQFGGIPSLFLIEDYDTEDLERNKEIILPINQVVGFSVIKDKQKIIF